MYPGSVPAQLLFDETGRFPALHFTSLGRVCVGEPLCKLQEDETFHYAEVSEESECLQHALRSLDSAPFGGYNSPAGLNCIEAMV